MKYAYLLRLAALLGLLALASAARAQGVGIGTTAPDASVALDIMSSAKGVLLPRLTASSRLGSAGHCQPRAGPPRVSD